MKKGRIIILIIVILIPIIWVFSAYNNLVNQEEKVTAQWADVETQYQRRAELIPNLVATVKGAAGHESNTFIEVAEARAKASSIRVNPADLTPEALEQFQQAQGQLSSALSRLLVENYPVLQANRNFLELQAQLEGTENRIAVERSRFNQVAQEYNTAIRRIPASIFASLFGFRSKPYFKSDTGNESAPEVSF
ncbi:MAG: LemA family protein [Prevotellaceae bacterium]|jgi:LemA protein|nr:LemA family protein [Prevotellaceae bacterium]